MSIWVRGMPAAVALVAAVYAMAWAQVPGAPPKSGLPLMSLDGTSQLGSLNSQPDSLKPSPIGATRGDTAAAGKVKIERPMQPPDDPKVLR